MVHPDDDDTAPVPTVKSPANNNINSGAAIDNRLLTIGEDKDEDIML